MPTSRKPRKTGPRRSSGKGNEDPDDVLLDLARRRSWRVVWRWFFALSAVHPVVLTVCLVVLYVATHTDLTVTPEGWCLELRSMF